jgi:COP9 signalosome complex subunit 1
MGDARSSSSSNVDSNFDLASYSSRYAGSTKLERLKHIAEKAPELGENAYRLMVEDIKTNTRNVRMYQAACETARKMGMDASISTVDNNWVEITDKFVKSRAEEINRNLQMAKTSLSKDEMRRAYMERGKLYQQQGDSVEAGKTFARCRDFVNTAAQSAEVSLAIAVTGLDIYNYSLAQQWISKIDVNLGGAYRNKCRAIVGIILMNDGDFKGAARNFLDIDAGIIGTFREVISAEDVATYGVLCTIATASFVEVQSLCQSKHRFKPLLELVPDLRMVLQNYSPSNSGVMLQWLDRRRGELSLDIHLKSKLDRLYSEITDRLLVQYFKPYRSVSIETAARKMSMPLPVLESRLAGLIATKKLAARIDSESRTLHANVTNERDVAINKVHEVATMHASNVKQSILRLSLVKNNFIVKRGGGDNDDDRRREGRTATSSSGACAADMDQDDDDY